MSISFISILIGSFVIFVGLFGLFIFPNIRLKSRKKEYGAEKKIDGIQCAEPNGNKINICVDGEITEEDEKLRKLLFEKHLKYYSEEGSPEYDGKIPIPFESLIFLTKEFSPIVNEDGEIIVRVDGSGDTLIVHENKDFAPGLKTDDSTKFFNELIENHSDIQEKKITKNKNVEDKNVEDKNMESENTEDKSVEEKNVEEKRIEGENSEDKNIENERTEDDGFLTTSVRTNNKPSVSNSLNEKYLKILNDEEDDDSLFDEIEEDDDSLFDGIDEDDDSLFDEIDDDINFNKKNDSIFSAKGRDEAEEFYSSFFITESLPLCDKSIIIGSTVDLDEVIEIFANNEQKIQEVFIKNLFAINGIGITVPDKILLVPKYSIIKAISTSITQIEGIKKAIEKHLKSTKGLKDLLYIIKFITSNPEFMISDQYKPFEFVSIEKSLNKYCKDNVLKLSHFFIEEIFPEESGIILKYPPYVVKITEKEAKNFCEH